MDGLPSNIVFDILSRIPVKSLACFRCVSKLWCEYIDAPYLRFIHGKQVVEESTPIIFHQNPISVPNSLCFHIVESSSKQDITTTHVLEREKFYPDFELVCQNPLSEDSIIRVRLQGSCNGLLFIAQSDGEFVTSMCVIHPLRKQCYELPAFSFNLPYNMSRASCGLGFDASTNTLKMVCVLLKESISPKNIDLVRKNLSTMVHVSDTNSWRKIPHVPCYPVEGKAIFAHGCLHWLVSYFDRPTNNEVIWFDVTREEFGLIDPPKRKETHD